MLRSLLLQSSSALLGCSVGALCLLRESHPWAGHGTHSTAANSSVCLLHRQAHEHTTSACTAADSHSHSLPHHCLSSSFLSKAGFHHAAVESAGSDEESASSNNTSSSRQHLARSNTAWLDQQRLHRQQQVQQHHHQQHIGQLHNMAGHQSQHTAAHPQQQTRYEGHLHAPHGRRHATSRSQVDSFISEQVRPTTAWCWMYVAACMLHSFGALALTGKFYAPCDCHASCVLGRVICVCTSDT